MIPEIVFRIVDLPAPFEPSTVPMRPRSTSRLTPRIARIGPYALSTLRSLSTHRSRRHLALAATRRSDDTSSARRGRPRSRPGRAAPPSGVPRREHLALVHRQHPVGDARHQRHVVLDHQHRDAELVRGCRRSRTPCRRSPRRSGPTTARRAGCSFGSVQSARASSTTLRTPYGRPATSDSRWCCRSSRSITRSTASRAATSAARAFGVNSRSAQRPVRAMRVPADQQVLQHGGVLEQLDVLEGAGDAERGDLVRRLRRSRGCPRTRSPRWSACRSG